MGCLAALSGALVGVIIGIALSFALLTGEEADALTWLASFVVLSLAGAVLGVASALVWRAIRKRHRVAANIVPDEGDG